MSIVDIPALQRFFADHVAECRGPLRLRLIAGGRSNLTYEVTDGHSRWVLRRPPLGTLTPTAHDMGREHRVVAALGASGVPVARSVSYCADAGVIGAPFSLMSYVDGQVHGDYRLDNTILDRDDPGTIRAIVDWEMAALGDPLADLGLMLVYWDPVCEPVLGVRHAPTANAGFPTGPQLAARYAEHSGRDISSLAFYQALGYLKLAVIAEGIHARHLAGRTVGQGFDAVGSAVPALLQAGLDTLATRRSRK